MIPKYFVYGYDIGGNVVYIYYDPEYDEASYGYGVCTIDIIDTLEDAKEFIEDYCDELAAQHIDRLSVGSILIEDVERKPQE